MSFLKSAGNRTSRLRARSTVRYSPSTPRQVVAPVVGHFMTSSCSRTLVGQKTNDEPNLSPLAEGAHHVHTSIRVHLWHTCQPGWSDIPTPFAS